MNLDITQNQEAYAKLSGPMIPLLAVKAGGAVP
jgi:hypothetical protein